MGSQADPTAAADTLTGVLLDEMYPPALAKQLRNNGHDVLAVLDMEVGLASRSDEDVLAWAARNNRCVVTENVADFARLASQGATHHGLIFVSAQRFPRTRAGLTRLADALTALLDTKQLPDPAGVGSGVGRRVDRAVHVPTGYVRQPRPAVAPGIAFRTLR